MNLTLRARIFAIVSIILLLILAISIAITVFSNKKTETENQLTNTQEGQEQQIFDEQTGVLINSTGVIPAIINENAPIVQMNDEEKMKSVVQNIAKIFVERYGSYSTDNPGQNLKDLEVLSTPDLWGVLKVRIENMSASQSFIGVSTRSFSSSLINFEKEKALVRVISAREENKNGEITNFNQEAEVSLIMVKDSWLVDDVKWK